MELRPLTLNDKPTIEKYLKKEPHALSSYAFENIFIWRSLFDIQWALINSHHCIFFKNRVGMFMVFPPLGGPDLKTIEEAFRAMEGVNHNKEISRIENIEADAVDFFKRNNFRVYEKSKDYIVGQKDIASYGTQRFRHKRNLYNFFKKNYASEFRDYRTEDREEVFALYRRWMQERMSKNKEAIYQAMLEDGFKAFSVLLEHDRDLDIRAKIVVCAGKIRAFTCGFPLSDKMFCINFEIADLDFKGLAQFIFSEFAKELKNYPEINIMDDSGLENILRTKMSFRPLKMVSSYTALLKA